MAESLKQKTVKGVVWSGVERLSVQAIQFVVTIIIARIVTPHDYGLIGMLAVFFAVAESIVDSGFSQALIRKKDRTEIDNCTVFYFNIVASVVLYIVLFAISPLVAGFYDESKLTSIMRVSCIIVVINSFAVVQRAIYTATLDFKTQAKATFTAAISSGMVGIIMALTGFGVWALVAQQITNAAVIAIMFWIFSDWYPRLLYSWKSFGELFSFGSKLLASGLINTIYKNLYSIVIGKVYNASSLGFYSRAQQFGHLPSQTLTGVLQRVTYPVLCSIQENDEKLANVYRKLLKVSAYIVFPVMVILAAIAVPLVNLLLGEKWLFTADLMLPICLTLMWYPAHSINLNLLQVKGRSDLFLRLEIIKQVFGVFVLAASAPFGLMVMCYCGIASTMISLMINAYYTGKLIGIGFIQQMKDLLPTYAVCILIFGLIKVFIPLCGPDYLQCGIGLIMGGFVYLFITYLFKFSEQKDLIDILKRRK